MLFSVFITSAQGLEPSDKAMPVFTKKSEPLTQATGYDQDKKTGKWIQNNNLISDMVVTPNDSFNIGFTDQNLIWFRSATLTYDAKKYYAFYYYYLSGQYKYPETKVDWIPFHATKFIIVEQADYLAFKNARMQKKGETISLTTIRSNTAEITGDFNEAKLLAEIASVLDNKRLHKDFCFAASAQSLNGKNIVRFRLPESCYFTKDLPKEYFETGLEDFKKIFVE